MSLNGLKKNDKIAIRRLSLAYIIALIMIALLVSLGFFTQAVMLSENRDIQEFTIQSSRQRALVHRIALISQRLAINEDGPTEAALKQDLQKTGLELKSSLDNLEHLWSARRPFHPHMPSNELASIYFSASGLNLHARLKDFLALTEDLIKGGDVEIHNLAVQEVTNRAQNELAALLDTFISFGVVDSKNRVMTLERTEVVIFATIILAILSIGLFLFRPIVQAIMRQQEEQSETKQNLEQRAVDLAISRDQLKQQTRILQSVLDAMGDAIIVADESGTVLLQNPAADRLFGPLTTPTPMGWHMQAGIHDPQNEIMLSYFEGPIQRALATDGFNEMLLLIKNEHSRDPVMVSATGRKMADERGKNKGAVISFHDVTDRIRNERELLSAKIKAENANVSKTQFLANVSHEIRTPMGVILGFADRLIHGSLSFEERQRFIQTIRRNAKLLMQLIDDILDISKIEAGQLEVERIEVSLEDLLAEIQSLFSWQAKEKQLTFKIIFDGPVPQRIRTDPTRLRQILVNVIGNAIKFTLQGSVTLCVRLQATATTPVLAFEVVDTGCGISPHVADKLFKPFQQADNSTTRKFGGTGLGLSISKRLAKALGGDLFIAGTEIGKGSIFVAQVDPGDLHGVSYVDQFAVLRGSRVAAENLFPSSGLEGKKILVVEDADENRDLVRFYLEGAGAKVTTAVDGVHGVELAFSDAFDLVLMDIQMPRLDGYHAVAIMRDKGFRAPVIALTAHAMKEEQERCRQAGFDAHVPKPIEAKQLVQTIRWHLSKAAGTADVAAKTKTEVAPKMDEGRREDAEAFNLSHMPAAVREIIQRFRNNLPQSIEELANLARAGDLAVLKSRVHRLKGTSGTCGMMDLMEDFAGLEQSLEAPGTGNEAIVAYVDGIARKWGYVSSSYI